MRKIVVALVLSACTHVVCADAAKQPPTLIYDYCNDKGTFCATFLTAEDVAEDEKATGIPTAGLKEAEVNYNLLLNLDYYYTEKCREQLNIEPYSSIRDDKTKAWGNCIIKYMTQAVNEKNKENLEYIEDLKAIFK